MAQINLLKQNTNAGFGGGVAKSLPKLFVRFFLLVLIALLGYYGWLVIDSKNLDSKTADVQQQIAKDTQQALGLAGRGELLTRQQQLQNLNSLITAHLYWSQLFQPLADATLKSASYNSLQVGVGNNLILKAVVPSLADLDKFTQAFNLPEVNKNFSNVIISGFTRVQGKNSSSVKFNAQMQYSPDLIKYHNPNAG